MAVLALHSMVFICFIIARANLASSYHPVILVSLDGMGWQFPQLANTPNLDNIAKTGVKAKYMETVTPTLTWPTHQSCLTGLYPESHGIVSNKFWDPEFKEKFIYDYDCSNYDSKFWMEAEPIWLTLQKEGIDTGVHFWPGFSSYNVKPTFYEKAVCKVDCSKIRDLSAARTPVRATYPPYDHCCPNYSIPLKKRVDSVVNWLTSKNSPRFVAFYVDQPDFVGHAYGSESQQFQEAIERVDREVVGYLVTKLTDVGLLDKVNLIFVADHSFTTINSSTLLFLEDFLDPSTYMVSNDGVPVHVWPKEGKLDEVYSNLTKLVKKLPKGKLYKKDEIPKEWHYRNNRRIPPIYLDPGYGWAVIQNRVNLPKDWVHGAHGYPTSMEMGSIFYARGPSFKKNLMIDHGLRSIDLYPMMCDILGVKPRPNNGSLDNMKILRHEDSE